MSQISVLDNVKHKDIKVDINKNVQLYHGVNRCVVYVSEIADLHKEFPILISKEPDTAKLQMHAILGLEKNENLFLSETGWTSRFVPALLARGPFSLGYPKPDSANEPKHSIICVDTDDTRVNTQTGHDLFLPFGGESNYLNYVKSALKSIELGMKYDITLFAMINKFDLLEPVSINIQLNESEEVSFNQYFTINQTKLAELNSTALEELSANGVLGVLFFLFSSMNNFQYLTDIKSKASGADILSDI